MNYRDRKFLDVSYQFDCMLRFPGCEGGAGEPLHSNQSKHGKGGALKAHDCFHIPACRSCHRELDQGRSMDWELKFAEWGRAFGLYQPQLFGSGILGVRK